MPCNLETAGHFGGKYSFHLQDGLLSVLHGVAAKSIRCENLESIQFRGGGFLRPCQYLVYVASNGNMTNELKKELKEAVVA
jgi:hypothetical protein